MIYNFKWEYISNIKDIEEWVKTSMSQYTFYKSISNCKQTLLVELLCALAPLWQSHNGHHLGTQTGAPLLVASQWRRVRTPTARTLLQAVHGPRDAGGAHHIPGCCTQAAEAAHPARAGHLHRAAKHHGPAGLEGRWAGGEGWQVATGLGRKDKTGQEKTMRGVWKYCTDRRLKVGGVEQLK